MCYKSKYGRVKIDGDFLLIGIIEGNVLMRKLIDYSKSIEENIKDAERELDGYFNTIDYEQHTLEHLPKIKGRCN